MSNQTDPKAEEDGGLFVSNYLERGEGSFVARTPCKAQPMGTLNGEEEIHPDAQNIVELIKKVDSISLSAYISEEESKIKSGMDEKLNTCSDRAFKFCFWKYMGDFPISKGDAQAIVQLAEDYSDVITVPLQDELLRAYVYDSIDADIDPESDEVSNSESPDLLRLYRIGIEHMVEASSDSELELVTSVPLLTEEKDDDFMKDLIQDYSEMEDINMLYFNLLLKKPTSPGNREVLEKLVGFMKRIGFFDPTLKYVINIMHSYQEEDNLRTAEDIALAAMGFDVIGENHWRLPNSPQGDYSVNHRQFDTENMVYWRVRNLDDLKEVWPSEEDTYLDPSIVHDAESDTEMYRVRRIINAEQAELALHELRNAIDENATKEFIREYNGMSILKDSFEAIAKEYDDPSVQTSFREYS